MKLLYQGKLAHGFEVGSETTFLGIGLDYNFIAELDADFTGKFGRNGNGQRIAGLNDFGHK